MTHRTSETAVRRWTDHGVSGVMQPVEVVPAAAYDDVVRELKQVRDELATLKGGK